MPALAVPNANKSSQASATRLFTFTAVGTGGTLVASGAAPGSFVTDGWIAGQKFAVTNSGTAMDTHDWCIRSVDSATQITVTNGYGALTTSNNNTNPNSNVEIMIGSVNPNLYAEIPAIRKIIMKTIKFKENPPLVNPKNPESKYVTILFLKFNIE